MDSWLLRLGKVDFGEGKGRANAVEVEVKLETKKSAAPHQTIDLVPVNPPWATFTELSICGSIWQANRRDWLTGGQCVETIAELFKGNADVERLCALWGRWHLNGMKAGTRKQQEFLAEHPVTPYDFTKACDAMTAAGVYVDRGYKYGTAWLVELLPPDVEREVRELCERLRGDSVIAK